MSPPKILHTVDEKTDILLSVSRTKVVSRELLKPRDPNLIFISKNSKTNILQTLKIALAISISARSLFLFDPAGEERNLG